MDVFLAFVVGAVVSPIVLLWLAKRTQKSQNQGAQTIDIWNVVKERLKIIADNAEAEPRAAKIAAKTLDNMSEIS
jgi:hypothetical protein